VREKARLLALLARTARRSPDRGNRGTRLGRAGGHARRPRAGRLWSLVTDRVNAALLRLHSHGSTEQPLDLARGSADLGYLTAEKLAIIPMMLDDEFVA